MTEDQSEIPSVVEKQITFVEQGPKFVDELGDLEGRTNIVKSTDEKGVERSFSEREGLEDLLAFVDKAIDVAEAGGDDKFAETARLFKNNLVFVGEKELQRATAGIAEHLIQEAREGKSVFLFWTNPRSERYITLRVLEEIDSLTEESPEPRSRFKVSSSLQEIAERCKENSGNSLVAIPDDFVVSGSRMTGFASKIFWSLLDVGFLPDQAAGMIEAETVGLKLRSEENPMTMGGQGNERTLKMFSFYKIDEYWGRDGKWAVYPGASFTGSHSSTDYGFESVLKDFSEYLRDKGAERPRPLLANIVRPYEADYDKGGEYKDPELQRRWEKVQERYKL